MFHVASFCSFNVKLNNIVIQRIVWLYKISFNRVKYLIDFLKIFVRVNNTMTLNFKSSINSNSVICSEQNKRCELEEWNFVERSIFRHHKCRLIFCSFHKILFHHYTIIIPTRFQFFSATFYQKEAKAGQYGDVLLINKYWYQQNISQYFSVDFYSSIHSNFGVY